jgi:hypothetical protein
MQLDNLSVDLLDAFDDYWSMLEERSQPETIPQLRTIPIGESIETHLEAMTYEATLTPETCEAGWTCLDRCQMETLVENGDSVALKSGC